MTNLRIKKIEIRNFRSIEHMEIDTDKGINVFTGKNDAGKSNILKALNLFFNDEIEIGQPFNYERDYRKQSKKRPDRDVQHRPLKIVLYFDYLSRNVVWEKTYLSNPEYERRYQIKRADIYSVDRKGKNPLQTNTLNLFKNVKYRYVPAIRDRKYTNHLLEELYKVLEETSRQEIVGAGGDFVKQIENKIEGLTEELDERLGLKSKLSLPTDFAFLFSKLDIHTIKKIQHNKELDILLQQKGDGIQNRYITQILASLTRIDNKRTIWGVEDPENNLEIGAAQEVADDFSNYMSSTSANLHQIFLTTHSPVFYSLENVNRFFISQDEQGKTSCKEITKKSKEEIERKMGLLPQLAKCLGEKEQQAKENDRLKNEIESEETPVMVVEGKTDKEYFKKAMNIFGKIDKLRIITAGGERKMKGIEKALSQEAYGFKPPTVIIKDIPQQSNKESREFEDGNIKAIQLKDCNNLFTAGGIEALFPKEDAIEVAESVEKDHGKDCINISYLRESKEVQGITIKGNKSEEKKFCRKMCAKDGEKAKQAFKNFEEYINQAKKFFKKSK